MNADCALCRRPEARPDCYVRFDREERPACRPCWEQLILDPRRVLRSLLAERRPAAPAPSAS